jgi:hypothetical protein
VPVPCFLLFLCFRKVTQKIFSELDETKAEVLIFPDTRRSPKERRRGPEGGRTMPCHGPPPGHARLWCVPLVHPLTSPFRLYILLDEITLRAQTLFQKTYCKLPPSLTRDRRVQKLFSAPCRRGESPPEAFFITMPAFGVMCD